jgi:hypothetical protein
MGVNHPLNSWQRKPRSLCRKCHITKFQHIQNRLIIAAAYGIGREAVSWHCERFEI